MAKKKVICPDWLSAEAKKEWRRVVPELIDIGIISGIDQALLAAYCAQYAVMVECEAYIIEQGGICKYLEGRNSQTSPHLAALAAARKYIKTVSAKFKLSPGAGAELALKRKKDPHLDW